MKTMKTIVAIIIIAMFLVSNSNAQTTSTASTNESFSVKYTGEKEGYLCFHIEFNGGNTKNKLLRISDKTEGELYTHFFPISTVTQNFLIEIQEEQVLVFNLTIGNKTYTKSYSFKTLFSEKPTFIEGELAAL